MSLPTTTISSKGTWTVKLSSPGYSASLPYNSEGFWKQSMQPVVCRDTTNGYGGNSNGLNLSSRYGISCTMLTGTVQIPQVFGASVGGLGVGNMERPLISDAGSMLLQYIPTVARPSTTGDIFNQTVVAMGKMQICWFGGYGTKTISPKFPVEVNFESLITNYNFVYMAGTVGNLTGRCVSVGVNNQGYGYGTANNLIASNPLNGVCFVPMTFSFTLSDALIFKPTAYLQYPGGYLINTLAGKVDVLLLPAVSNQLGATPFPQISAWCPDFRSSSSYGEEYLQGAFYICEPDSFSSRPYLGATFGEILYASPVNGANQGNRFMFPAYENYGSDCEWPGGHPGGQPFDLYQFRYGYYCAIQFSDPQLDAMWVMSTPATRNVNISPYGFCIRLFPAGFTARDIILWFKGGSDMQSGYEAYYYDVTWDPQDDASKSVLLNPSTVEFKFDDTGQAFVYGAASAPVSITTKNSIYAPKPYFVKNIPLNQVSCFGNGCDPIAAGNR